MDFGTYSAGESCGVFGMYDLDGGDVAQAMSQIPQESLDALAEQRDRQDDRKHDPGNDGHHARRLQFRAQTRTRRS